MRRSEAERADGNRRGAREAPSEAAARAVRERSEQERETMERETMGFIANRLASPCGRLGSPAWIASHLFVAAMVVLMANLGFWQLRRLDQRRVDNSAIASAMSQPPADIAQHLDTRGVPPDYTTVAATGTYRADAVVRIGNRSSGGQPGHWLAAPLELRDGRAVAVVRGWVPRRAPAGLDDRSTAPPAGQVTVVGLAFGSVGGGRIAITDPGDAPEISRMDLERFEEVSGVDVVDAWIRLRGQTPPQAELFPSPVPDPDLNDGPHLSYSFQWFFFSAGAVVVYGLILRRAASERDSAVGTA